MASILPKARHPGQFRPATLSGSRGPLQGPVLYIAAEDLAGMRMRFSALRQRYGDTGNLHLLKSSVVFDLEANDGTPPDVQAVIDLADRIGAVLIVIDTLSRIAAAWDENDNRSMRRLVDCLRALCGERRAVLAVHHSAKAGAGNEGGATPRGHGVLNGDADVTLRVTRVGKTDRSKVELGKNRNGTSSGAMMFDIVPIDLGIDEDGDPITAVVAETEPGDTIAANDNQRDGSLRKVSPVPADAASRLNVARSELLAAIKSPVVAGETSDAEPEFAEWVTRDRLIARLVGAGWFGPDEIRQDHARHAGSRHPVVREAQTRLTKDLYFLGKHGLIEIDGDRYRAV